MNQPQGTPEHSGDRAMTRRRLAGRLAAGALALPPVAAAWRRPGRSRPKCGCQAR